MPSTFTSLKSPYLNIHIHHRNISLPTSPYALTTLPHQLYQHSLHPLIISSQHLAHNVHKMDNTESFVVSLLTPNESNKTNSVYHAQPGFHGRGIELIMITAILNGVALLVVLLRFWMRVKPVMNIGRDDVAILGALVRLVHMLDMQRLSERAFLEACH